MAGVKAVTLSTETDPSAASLKSELPAGAYTIKLKTGWTLERESNGMWAPVKAVLFSQNPAGFQIFDQFTTPVVFQFRAGEDVVELGNGQLEVDIAVDDGFCPPGQAACDGGCTDIVSDPNNCGFCGNVCAAPNVCGNGFCQMGCAPGQQSCFGQCVDVFSDPFNCGGCGIVCSAGDSCQMGACMNPCGPGNQLCNGVCVDSQNDPSNCGSCGNVCAPGLSCSNGLCHNDGPLLEFSGVANDLPIAALSGWTQCFSETYNGFTPVADILASCNQGRLLLGCRQTGSDTLLLAANAPRQDVLFDCGSQIDCSNVSNGVGWYFSDSYSWGFVQAGEPVNRVSCDLGDETESAPNSRMCWHTGGGATSSGFRCGDDLWLNGDTSFERVIFQAP